MRNLTFYNRQAGVGMLEVLITIVILTFGLLGLAGLQGKWQLSEMESYQRAQAVILLDDMALRIKANPDNIANYLTTDPVGTGTTQADCSTLTDTVERDLCEWSNALLGAAEMSGSNTLGAMLGARGCIESVSAVAPVTVRVSVVWQGNHGTVIPAFSCGEGLFGSDDSLRRLIAQTVVAADLK